MAIRKITVNLPEDQIEFLQGIATQEHITFTDALRRAINSEKFFVEQTANGNKILIEESGRRLREVIRK